MGQQVADVCDLCGKTVVKQNHADSSNMVVYQCGYGNSYGSLLFMGDCRKGELARSSFSLTKGMWCPGCLKEKLGGWLDSIV